MLITALVKCAGYADSTYTQYSPQSYTTQQSDSAASQINQLAFATNNAAAGQYLAAQAASSPVLNVISCYPSAGTLGTKVSMKVTSQGDLLSGSMSSSAPFVSVLFGSHRSAADVVKNSQDSSNGTCTYTITAEAPSFLSTTCPSLSNVPLTLLAESANGTEIARASNAGVFSYHDANSTTAGNSVGVGGSGDTSPPDLGSPKTRSPVQRGSPPHHGLPVPGNTTSPPGTRGHSNVPVTNTYGFPPSLSVATAASQTQRQASSQSDYVADTAAAYNQGSSSMLGTFRSSSFADHYPRAPPVLRSPHGVGWTPFGNHMDSVRSSVTTIPHSSHTSITRPSLTPLQHSNSNAPQLVRTSTLSQQGGGGSGNANYNPYALYQTKASLKLAGDLVSMAENWNPEEWDTKRRLVLFKKQQNGTVVTTSFKPVSASERPPNSICISCIWWAEKEDCFVTSVDTIYLLEQLLAAPNRFSVEEKNRIRRNLEGFHPLTVSKGKAESEEFFKVIMSFGNPKPRNIEKDVKVFPWKILGQALSKIISKYSAATASLNTQSLSGSYPALHPNNPGPASSTAAGDIAGAGYINAAHHHTDSINSPGSRPHSGGPHSWAAYSGAGTRTMSPSLKTSSPISTSGLRISTLPAVYDSRGSTHSLTSPYSVSSAHHGSHHSQGSFGQAAIPVTQGHARSWEAYSAAESYPAHASHSHVYSGGPYGEGTQRA